MRRVFDLMVGVGADNGLIGGSIVHADANRARKAAPEEVEATWASSDGISRPVQEYLDSLEDNAAPALGPKHKPPKYLSETDPQAAWSLKDGPGRFYEGSIWVGGMRPVNPTEMCCSAARRADLHT